MSVSGWANTGGSELGISHKVPATGDLHAIANTLEKHKIDAIMMVGGWAGYQSMLRSTREGQFHRIQHSDHLCATINNNLPGSELSIGADTAVKQHCRSGG